MGNYRIDDLQWGNLKLKQNTDLFCFGTDAVLLSHFFKPEGETKVCDFGCASGILSVLIGGKNPDIEVVGIEIQSELYSLAEENKKLNSLDNVTFINCDIRDAYNRVGHCSSVICNPPYDKIGCGILPDDICNRIARYECMIDFDGISAAASKLLETGGKFYFIHRTSRLDDIQDALSAHQFHIKHIRFIHKNKGSNAELMLVCAVKNGKSGLQVMRPLIIYDSDGKFSLEVEEYYRKYE